MTVVQTLRGNKLALGAAVAALFVIFSSIVVVPESQQAVVLRLGEPVRVINRFRPGVDFGRTGAGVVLRVPLLEEVVRIDKRVLSLEMDSQQVISSDQRRLEVDAYARYRIIDPVKMVRTAGSVERVGDQLQPILTSVLRQELGSNTFASLLTPERGEAMAHIREGLDRQARDYGAQVIDVRIKKADLPPGALESAFAQMRAAREQEATTIRAQGQKNAYLITADAEARAARIYADSFGKDPGFYDFYRAMKSYDATFANPETRGGSTIILSPQNEYLKQFKGN
ncbi:protease modulator HflC [Parablastomonas sp. CN1-191]|uniref:protease modulator HflC n=1 Tax=Parablastomonas sp. CN1-191 TaxID=3400908 RepID=UPI003BF83EF3